MTSRVSWARRCRRASALAEVFFGIQAPEEGCFANTGTSGGRDTAPAFRVAPPWRQVQAPADRREESPPEASTAVVAARPDTHVRVLLLDVPCGIQRFRQAQNPPDGAR